MAAEEEPETPLEFDSSQRMLSAKRVIRRDGPAKSKLSGKGSLDLPLPPRALRQKVKKRAIAYRVLVGICSLFLVGFALYFGTIVLLSDKDIQQDCGAVTATGVETWFAINLRVPGTFSYSDVRLIDISWDIVVGQFGRMFHGWLFYKHIIVPHLVRLMERSAVPLSTYISILFETTSLRTIGRLLKSCTRMPSRRTVLAVIWYVLAIGYVLSFSTLWNATTGYVNPSSRSFKMPDGAYANTSNEEPFSLCYSHNDSRLEGIVPNVVTSPSLAQLQADFSEGATYTYDYPDNETLEYMRIYPMVVQDYQNSFPGEILLLGNSSNVSAQFRDINYYQSTSCELLTALGTSNWPSFDYSTDGSIHEEIPATLSGHGVANSTLDAIDNFMKLRSAGRSPYSANNNLYTQINGYFYGAATTNINDTSASLNSTFHSEPPWGFYTRANGYYTPSSYSGSTGQGQEPTVGAEYLQQTLWPGSGWPANFSLNTSVNWNVSGMVLPYNSSLVFNGTLHALPAPFVDFNYNCPPLQGLGGVCLCYNSVPVSYRLDKSQLACISETGYVWGYSANLLAIAIFLEAVWIVGCFGMWADTRIHSRLLRMRRAGAGPVRAAFDLVGLAARDIGPDHSTYSDRDLRKALDECGLVGYEWRQEDGNDGDASSSTAVSLIKREIPTREQRRRDAKERRRLQAVLRRRRPLARDMIQRAPPRATDAWESGFSRAPTELTEMSLGFSRAPTELTEMSSVDLSKAKMKDASHMA